MHRPCDNCPFRTDIPAYLNTARAEEIAHALRNDGSFHCHKTIDYDSDDVDEDGFEEPRVTPQSKFCMGALVVMKKDGSLFANRLIRMIAHCGEFHPDALDMDAPLPESLDDWIERQPDR